MKRKILLVYRGKCLLYITINLFESFFVLRIKFILILTWHENQMHPGKIDI